jgi:hypothetical protein
VTVAPGSGSLDLGHVPNQSGDVTIGEVRAVPLTRYPADLPGGKVPKCWYAPCALPEEAALAWRWALAQDVDVAIPSGNAERLRLALALTPGAKPLSEDERGRLVALSEKAEPLFPPEEL